MFFFLKIRINNLLLVCRVSMWETPSVFHMLMRFSFFASFFLFVGPPFFVDNSSRDNQRLFLLPFSRIFLPAFFQYIPLLMRLGWCQVVTASMGP
jgi:hypothetical protein